LIECLEDWQDARAADKAYQRIVDGDAKILSWDEVKAGLYDMDN
jgi:predicted DNA-binding protein